MPALISNSSSQALADVLKKNSFAGDIDLTGDAIGAKGAEARPLVRWF